MSGKKAEAIMKEIRREKSEPDMKFTVMRRIREIAARADRRKRLVARITGGFFLALAVALLVILERGAGGGSVFIDGMRWLFRISLIAVAAMAGLVVSLSFSGGR